MKIALIGTAPASIRLAPYGDPSWQIWGCSPGAYAQVPRSEMWFEIHRWQPGVVGKAETQVSWFTPEYVAWLKTHRCVWVFDALALNDLPNAKMIPHQALRAKYGDYFFTSTLSWMFAMAMECIKVAPAPEDGSQHMIGLWGVDMAATEEYGYQRAGCQFFAQLAQSAGIQVYVPPESDLLTPPPLYGLFETTHRGIKLSSRMAEIKQRLAHAEQRRAAADQETMFLKGAVDDLQYHMNNWLFDEPGQAADMKGILEPPKEEPKEAPKKGKK